MISFPKLESWNNITKTATIVAQIDKKSRVLCRISSESLRVRFGASDDTTMQLIAKHRTIIQQAAANLIERDSYQEDGSILIQTSDL